MKHWKEKLSQQLLKFFSFRRVQEILAHSFCFYFFLLRHHLLLSFKPCVARHPQKTENALLIIPNYGLKYSPALITAFFSFFSLHRLADDGYLLLTAEAGKRQKMRWNKNISNKQEREEVREREVVRVFTKRKRNLLDVLLSHSSLSLFLWLSSSHYYFTSGAFFLWLRMKKNRQRL